MSSRCLYVIGFPKSGTVWLSRMLCHALGGRIEVAMPDPGGAVGLRLGGGGGAGDGPVIRWTHFTPSALSGFVSEEPETGIYIYRDFRDILVSGFLFTHTTDHEAFLARDASPGLGRALRSPVDAVKRHYWGHVSRRAFREFITRICMDGWKPFGGWSEHVRRWRDYSRADSNRVMAFVSYEALRQDTLPLLERTLETLEVEMPAQEKLVAAVEQNSVTRLRPVVAARRAQDHGNRPFRDPVAGTLRKGAVGDYLNYMTPADLRLVERTHGPMLRELGYL